MGSAEHRGQGDRSPGVEETGSRAQDLLHKPVWELSDEELAEVGEYLRAQSRARNQLDLEAEAASEKFRLIIQEIEGLSETQFEIRCKDIARRHRVSVSLLRKWWRQLHEETSQWKASSGRKVVDLPRENGHPFTPRIDVMQPAHTRLA
jgi:hypothetical protein